MAGNHIKAGKLDKRLGLWRPDYGDAKYDDGELYDQAVYSDGFQAQIAAWIPVGKVWASIEQPEAKEIDEAARKVAVVEIKIVIRYRSDIDHRWRLTHRTDMFEVFGITNPLNRYERLELDCRQVL